MGSVNLPKSLLSLGVIADFGDCFYFLPVEPIVGEDREELYTLDGMPTCLDWASIPSHVKCELLARSAWEHEG